MARRPAETASADRYPRDSPLCRHILHYKIENDLDGLVEELMQANDGKSIIRNLLHSAADAGYMDFFEFRRDPFEYGIRFFACSRPVVDTQQSRGRTTGTALEAFPRSRAPFRGQMFITAALEDGSSADFVWKPEKFLHVLGEPLLPRRPHSAPRDRRML